MPGAIRRGVLEQDFGRVLADLVHVVCG